MHVAGRLHTVVSRPGLLTRLLDIVFGIKGVHCSTGSHQTKKLVVIVADKDVFQAAFTHLQFHGEYAGWATRSRPANEVAAGNRAIVAPRRPNTMCFGDVKYKKWPFAAD